MTVEGNLRIVGLLLLGLAAIHVIFPRYFNWRDELARLSLINRQVMKVHTLFIALVVLMMGLLCLTSAHDLSSTILGRRIALGLAFFWLVRLIVQHIGYSSELWRGKRFETMVHIVFTLLWAYLALSFGMAAFPD